MFRMNERICGKDRTKQVFKVAKSKHCFALRWSLDTLWVVCFSVLLIHETSAREF